MRIAVILLNLGGPDSLDAVKPYLFNLFYDPAIIRLPKPIRYMAAKMVAATREEKAREIFASIGGASPILAATNRQAEALEVELNRNPGDEHKVFIAMRHWHPFAAEAVKEVKEYGSDEIILLPLYPQFSTTTTGSSLTNWAREAETQGLKCITKRVCCYFGEGEFIDAHAQLTWKAYKEARAAGIDRKPRILFSAHGLPENFILDGDPYRFQTEETVKAVVKRLEEISIIPEAVRDAEGKEEIPKSLLPRETFDHVTCYQSRVGIMKWLSPAIDDELKRAAAEGVPVVVVPVSFVSEHSETLAELDIKYKEMAKTLGLPGYTRVPALSLEKGFIKSLVGLVEYMKRQKKKICSYEGVRSCPDEFIGCPNR